MYDAETTYNPAAEAFKNFDQEQNNSTLLGSLHLDTEEEPRRGASRANSVRFDESALHGHFTQGSRSSSDFFLMRTGSGFGSHPMTERSSSHKSEGRQSSLGQPSHSARLNSLGLDTRQPGLGVATPTGPPPGLFLLTALPSIIRCWLDTNFSNDSLLYAAVCTGSGKSTLGQSLVSRLGLQDQIAFRDKERKIKLQVYLPEATIQHSSARSSSPAPQLPVVTVDFTVNDIQGDADAIQIYLGSDILRLRNADILFSQDRLTLLDDARNKVAVPLVRPEKTALYQNLRTVHSMLDQHKLDPDSDWPGTYNNARSISKAQDSRLRVDTGHSQQEGTPDFQTRRSSFDTYSPITPSVSQPSAVGDGRGSTLSKMNDEGKPIMHSEDHAKESVSLANGTTPNTPTRTEASSIWGSWRRESGDSARQELSFSNVASNPSYQRAGRGRGMKVLKPGRSATMSRSTPMAQTPTNSEPTSAQSCENDVRGIQNADYSADAQIVGPPGMPLSSETKLPFQHLTNKSRSANPIGGASAFGWLNSSQQKRSSATAE